MPRDSAESEKYEISKMAALLLVTRCKSKLVVVNHRDLTVVNVSTAMATVYLRKTTRLKPFSIMDVFLVATE